MKTLARIADGPTQIRADHLPNKNPMPYRYANSLDEDLCC
jgi:hypothetical protein